MHEWEWEWQGNRGLMIWLREIAKYLGIRCGGKRIGELMDEIHYTLERQNANNQAYKRLSSNSGRHGLRADKQI